MEMRQVVLTLSISADELWSRIFGAEPFVWEWWTGAKYGPDTSWDKAGTITIQCDNPDDEDEEPVTKTLTVDDLIDALHKAPRRTQSDLINDNMDSDSADIILQIAVLGDIIYG